MIPRVEPFSFGQSPIFAGESAQVTCFVPQGDLPLDISWSFEGSDDLSSLGVTVTKAGKKSSILFIDDVTSDNSGNYTCTGRNPYGTSSFTAFLEVHGNVFRTFFTFSNLSIPFASPFKKLTLFVLPAYFTKKYRNKNTKVKMCGIHLDICIAYLILQYYLIVRF